MIIQLHNLSDEYNNSLKDYVFPLLIKSIIHDDELKSNFDAINQSSSFTNEEKLQFKIDIAKDFLKLFSSDGIEEYNIDDFYHKAPKKLLEGMVAVIEANLNKEKEISEPLEKSDRMKALFNNLFNSPHKEECKFNPMELNEEIYQFLEESLGFNTYTRLEILMDEDDTNIAKLIEDESRMFKEQLCARFGEKLNSMMIVIVPIIQTYKNEIKSFIQLIMLDQIRKELKKK